MTISSDLTALSIQNSKRDTRPLIAARQSAEFLRRFSRLLLAVPLTFMLATFSFAASGASDNFGVDRILERIKWEIRNAQGENMGSSRLTIKEVELELVVAGEQGDEGSIQLVVPTMPIVNGKLSAVASQGLTHKIHLTFTPPRQIEVSSGAQLDLVKTIRAFKRALQNAVDGPPQLNISNYHFEVTFAVARETNGRMRPLVFDANGPEKNVVTHTAKVLMSRF